MRLVSLFLVSAAAFGGTAAQWLPKAPVRFEPNLGQIRAAKGAAGKGTPSAPILWAARGAGYAIAFTKDATLFELGSRTVSMRLRGQNSDAPFAASSQLSAPTNYFTPAYRGTVPNYQRLRRNQIYPGIDLVYYGTGDRLEYDFEIAPGADPSRIRIHFAGAQKMTLAKNGDLLLQLGSDVITQHAPVVYQKKASGGRVLVPASYRIAANREVTVALSGYDATAPLVIDPVISFAAYSYTSGTSNDTGVAIAHDSKGFFYVAGNTSSTDFPTTTNGAYAANTGSQDVWLMKLNPAAASADQIFVYSSYFGGTSIDSLKAMTIDANGWVYLTGSTTSTDLVTTDRAFQTTNGGTTDGFVAVFDPGQSGRPSLLYSTYLGGAAVDEPAGIAVANNKVYVTGSTLSDNFPLARAFQAGRNVGRDAFVTEIDIFQSGAASMVASTYFGGSGSDYGRTIAVDAASGNAFIGGVTYSADLPVSGNAYQSVYGGAGDAFLTQFDINLRGGYSTYLGGSGTDEARKIVVDPTGRIALTGYTSSANFAITQNAAQPLLGAGATNAFLTLIDTKAAATQALVYSTYFGGSVAEVANDLQLDATGNYYFGGYSMSPDLPVSQNALSPVSGQGGLDGFIAVINTTAPPLNALRYSSYITGPGSQMVNGVDADATGAIYVTGYASGDIFPAGYQPHLPERKTDAFVLIFTP